MSFYFSPKAADDLKEIADYISRDNPSRAISFLDELEYKCQLIAEMPGAYPLRENLGFELRIAVHKDYLILFRIIEEVVRIERIVHGARKITDL